MDQEISHACIYPIPSRYHLFSGLYLYRTKQKKRRRGPTSMPQVGYDSTISLYQRQKTMHALDFGVTVITITEYGHTQNQVRTGVNPIVFKLLFCNKLGTTQDIFVGNRLLGADISQLVTDPLYDANYSTKQADSFQAGKKKSYFSRWSKKNVVHVR